MTSTGAPPARESHTAVWTGKEMIVWGGHAGEKRFNDTFTYTPDTGPFRILSVFRNGANLTIRFPTVAGCTYILSTSAGLADGSWTVTGLPLIGSGAVLSFTVLVVPATRFFRIEAAP